MERRTNWDFSGYTHRVEIFKSEEGNEIRVDHLRKGDSNVGYVKFVNDDRGLSVFGDFGNWIFCRPFHPAPDNFVSDGYWNEKLKMHSSQNHAVYSEEETTKEIQELIDSGLEEYGYEVDKLEQAKEWLRDLLPYVSNEIEYAYHAYYCGNPVDMDYEMIPFCKEGSFQLKIVFDAFDEICSRLKTQQNKIDIEHPVLYHPKGSAKKVFDEFWKEVEKDNCDRKTLASISFDAGHQLRHEEYEKIKS